MADSMVVHELLYSMKASAHGNAAQPSIYRLALLVRLPFNSPPPVAELLPDARLVTHPDARRRWSP